MSMHTVSKALAMPVLNLLHACP